jgi:3-deoxy-D-manno-octulosonic-acid transferase
MFLLYNLLLTLLSPFWVPWMILRSRRREEKPNWRERSGNYELSRAKDRKRIWFHAVSVGEVVAALPILRHLRQELPDDEILLSVTTSSGHRTAREQAADLVDHVVYFPIDIARFQLSAMQRVQPAVVAIMETELWMNFLWAAKVFDAKTLLVNGRISDRSFRRSKRFAFFYRSLLRQMDRCLMQTRADAERIRALGADEPEVLGNCKFDQALEGLDADPARWRETLGLPPGRPVLVIGSTRGPEEERFVHEALALLGSDRPSVVHAPRHLERAPEVGRAASDLGATVGFRSKGDGGDYVILDTYGELSKVYSVADVVVIGGGFANLGGQNLLQALAHGKPVLHGPHMQNFRSVAEASVAEGSSRICATPADLAEAIRQLLNDPEARAAMSAAATRLVAENAGASRRYAQAIAEAARAAE